MVSKLRGGKRTVKEVKEFINASYDENPPEKIGDFILDKNLTTSTGKVYPSILAVSLCSSNDL